MKEIKRKVFIVKYKYGSQWYEYHCQSKAKATAFIERKQADAKMGIAVVKVK
jgi:hypothetical protein